MLHPETPLASFRRCCRIAALALDAGDAASAIRSLLFAWPHARTECQRRALAGALEAVRSIQRRT